LKVGVFMKKKIISVFFILIALVALSACSSNNVSTSYGDLKGAWQLDSKYIDGEAQDIKWTILEFKSDKTVDIYEYTKEIKSSTFRKDAVIPDRSEFTLISTSNVEVKSDTVSYQYNDNTVKSKFYVDLNSVKMHFYIENEDGKIIHQIYKSADKSKRP